MSDPIPIYQSNKPHEVVPDRYVLHYTINRCTNCGYESHDSKFYAQSFLRSRVSNQRVKHIIPCPRPIYNLPVERVLTGRYSTPFCAECPSTDLSHLPNPPVATPARIMSEPVVAFSKPARAQERTKPAPPRKPTIEDLA